MTCFVLNKPLDACETFIRAQVQSCTGDYRILRCRGVRIDGPAWGWWPLTAGPGRLLRYACGRLPARDVQSPAIKQYLIDHHIHAVVAHYAHVAIPVMEGCRAAGVPLIVHCHGHDVFRRSIVDAHADEWPRLFRIARFIIAVSNDMRDALIARGAPADRVLHIPYGVELTPPGDPAAAGPHFVAVGRFVPKKSPQLTLRAFAAAPDATLTMIGDGPLLETCRREAQSLGIADRVTFAGRCAPHQVLQTLRTARGFVQHSVIADDGDAEGTPLAVLEACAAGLPVIATRHMGIKDVIEHNVTGLLCDERDVDAMSEHIAQLTNDPQRAQTLGAAARGYVEQHHNITDYHQRVRDLIASA